MKIVSRRSVSPFQPPFIFKPKKKEEEPSHTINDKKSKLDTFVTNKSRVYEGERKIIWKTTSKIVSIIIIDP